MRMDENVSIPEELRMSQCCWSGLRAGAGCCRTEARGTERGTPAPIRGQYCGRWPIKGQYSGHLTNHRSVCWSCDQWEVSITCTTHWKWTFIESGNLNACTKQWPLIEIHPHSESKRLQHSTICKREQTKNRVKLDRVWDMRIDWRAPPQNKSCLAWKYA